MRTSLTFIITVLLTLTSFGQSTKKVMKKMGRDPVIFIDSIEVEMSILWALNPVDISNISIVKPKKAKKLFGNRGIDGAVYVTTKKAAKVAYWNFFREKSENYKKLIEVPEADTIVQYVLNGESLSDSSAPGSLFLITDKNFESISIIDNKGNFLNGNIPQRYIVAINAKRPKGLLKPSKEK